MAWKAHPHVFSSDAAGGVSQLRGLISWSTCGPTLPARRSQSSDWRINRRQRPIRLQRRENEPLLKGLRGERQVPEPDVSLACVDFGVNQLATANVNGRDAEPSNTPVPITKSQQWQH
jgi:hypothetical protein